MEWNLLLANFLTVVAGVVLANFLRSLYAEFLERMKLKNQLRLAVLDQRLRAYQEAYALSGRLSRAAHAERPTSDVFEECNAWWNNNCLYLEANAREKFLSAYYAARNHPELKRIAAEHSSPENMAALTENWKKITDAPKAIAKAVELPSLGEEEDRLVTPSEDGDSR